MLNGARSRLPVGKGVLAVGREPSQLLQILDACVSFSRKLREEAFAELILWALAINGLWDLIARL